MKVNKNSKVLKKIEYFVISSDIYQQIKSAKELVYKEYSFELRLNMIPEIVDKNTIIIQKYHSLLTNCIEQECDEDCSECNIYRYYPIMLTLTLDIKTGKFNLSVHQYYIDELENDKKYEEFKTSYKKELENINNINNQLDKYKILSPEKIKETKKINIEDIVIIERPVKYNMNQLCSCEYCHCRQGFVYTITNKKSKNYIIFKRLRNLKFLKKIHPPVPYSDPDLIDLLNLKDYVVNVFNDKINDNTKLKREDNIIIKKKN